jgi:hypothetical protein
MQPRRLHVTRLHSLAQAIGLATLVAASGLAGAAEKRLDEIMVTGSRIRMTSGMQTHPSFAAWAEGLQLSLDWYKIDVVGLIASLSAQRIVDDRVGDAAFLCDYVVRDPALGIQLTRVKEVFLNIIGAVVEGVDAEAIYSTELDLLGYSGETAGGSSWRATSNITNLFDREPPIIPSFSTRLGTQTLSNEYDVFDRRYQVSVNYDFL